MMRSLRQHLPFDQANAFLSHSANQAWETYYGEWDASLWAFLQRILDYDPLPALERVRCPILALFGERDTIVPVQKAYQDMII